MGTISYQGRAIDTERMPIKFGQSQSGMVVLEVTVAEQHRVKNSKAAAKYKNADKRDDDYVPTTTSWHRLTVFGEKAKELASDPEFGGGCILEVTDALYTEEDPWKTKDEVLRAGRPETIGDNGDATVTIREYQGRVFGRADDAREIWDGAKEIPALPRSGGGGASNRVADDEGF